MSHSPRITYHGALVLQSLAAGHRYGFQIMDFCDLPSGTVYPILRRFEAAGLVSSDWEEDEVARRGRRPRRRNYELTASGSAALTASTERFRTHQRVFGTLTSDGPAGGGE